jgi:KRAB domain-containing zinc finger protein
MSGCEMCVTTFTHERSAIRVSERPYSRNECNKIFPSHSNLDIHIRVHTGERLFSYEMCKERFAQRSNLNTNLRVHSERDTFCFARRCH